MTVSLIFLSSESALRIISQSLVNPIKGLAKNVDED